MAHTAVIYGSWNSLPLQSCSCRVIGPFIRIMRKPSCRVTDALRIRSAGPERGGGRGAGGGWEQEDKEQEEDREEVVVMDQQQENM